jgi:molecular chaperone HscB
LDHFERLGLRRGYEIDAAQLERHYLERGRAVHPDHTGNEPASIAASAALNEAYSVLRDPFRRADYLLALAGGPTPKDVSQPPSEFLEEMLELRMQIEEAKGDPSRRSELERSLGERRSKLLSEAGAGLDTPGDRESLNRVRQTLNAAKFINGLLRDLNEE